jgi:hypothetical protein
MQFFVTERRALVPSGGNKDPMRFPLPEAQLFRHSSCILGSMSTGERWPLGQSPVDDLAELGAVVGFADEPA